MMDIPCWFCAQIMSVSANQRIIYSCKDCEISVLWNDKGTHPWILIIPINPNVGLYYIFFPNGKENSYLEPYESYNKIKINPILVSTNPLSFIKSKINLYLLFS